MLNNKKINEVLYAICQVADVFVEKKQLEQALSAVDQSKQFTLVQEQGGEFPLWVMDGFRTPVSLSNHLLLFIPQGKKFDVGLIGPGGVVCSTSLPGQKACPPRFFWDFEGIDAQPLFEFLKNKLGAWSVQPRLQCHVALSRWQVLDKRQKLVARLDVIETQQEVMKKNAGRKKKSEFYVISQAIRGFDDQLMLINDIISQYSSAQRSIMDEFQLALEHQSAADYAPLAHLLPDDNAFNACCKLLHAAAAEMVSHTPGLLEDRDSEFLHQYRVNLRKTRSLLKECRPVFAGEKIERFLLLFKKLSELTTPIRDYDVHMLMLQGWVRGRLDRSECSAAMSPLLKLIIRKRNQALKKLRDLLTDVDYQSDMEAWLQYLKDGSNLRKSKFPHSIERYAGKRVGKAYKRLVSDGHNLTESSPDEDFHELRLDFKRLRYLFEYFLPIFDDSPFKNIYKQTKKLQSVLGDFQDITVQKAALMAYLPELEKQRGTTPVTFMCIGQIVQDMGGNHDALKQSFFELFLLMDTPENADYIATLGRTSHKKG